MDNQKTTTNTQKTPEELAREHTYDNLMSMIVAKTFSRHAGLSETDYLKEIGFDKSGKSEAEAVRTAFLNLLVASTKELLKARTTTKNLTALLTDCLADEKDLEEIKKGDIK